MRPRSRKGFKSDLWTSVRSQTTSGESSFPTLGAQPHPSGVGRDKRKRNLSRKPQSFMPSPVSANAVTTPCEKKKSKKRMRNTELTSNIPPLFDKADEDLARRLVDQKLHAAAHAVRRFMQTHGAAMTDLERFEPQIRKEGRYREYMAVVMLCL